jgi:hypothetical protein
MIPLLVNEVIIRHRSKKDKKYNGKKIEDINEVIIRHSSKKDRKYNGKKIEDTLVSSIFLPLYFLSFFDLCLMIPLLVSSIFLPLYFLSFFDICLMIPLLVPLQWQKDRGYQ